MNAQDIEALLWQDESETLDFKRDQYPFDDATDDQRSELLKDILAFANAWRTASANILIGVDEVKYGRSVPVGTHHLLNRTLQTFLKSGVNRPVDFSYQVIEVDSRSIGVIEIPCQTRPFFLSKKYGKLDPNTVYIRRKDITDIANPDEIARMGAMQEAHNQPLLEFSFGDLEKRMPVEDALHFVTRNFEVPKDEDFPAYGRDNAFGISIDNENEDFYADTAAYMHDVPHLQPVGVVVRNDSRVVAQKVVVRITFQDPQLEVMTSGERRPEPVRNNLRKMMRTEALIKRGVTVFRLDRHTEVEVELGDIQPGTSTWSQEPFYVGNRDSNDFEATITISGHNIAEPVHLKRSLKIDTEAVQVSVEQVISLAEKLDR